MSLALLSGLWLTSAFPRLAWFPMAWVALIPLLVAIDGKDLREAFGLGYVCGLAHFLTVLQWIHFVIQHYGNLPMPAAVGVLFLLGAYLALYPAVFAVAAAFWQGRPQLRIWVLPAVWVTLEWVRAHAITGFPWANLGYSQGPCLALTQLADLGGVLGVSWLVVLGNTCLHTLLWRSGSRWNLAVGAALVVAALGYAQLRLEQLEAFEREAPAMTVAVAQGNVDQARKWDPLFQEETLRRYRDLSMAARRQAGNLDLLVWPETATPFFFQLDPQLTEQVEAIVKEVRCPVVFGSPAVTQRNGRSRLLNRAYLLSETADVLGYYDKQHLVPFGEYVPYQRILFFVHKLVQAAGDFVAGEDSTPLRLDGRRLGLLICYEAIFPGLAREAKRHGGDVLVNITNDAWFGNSSAPHQHLEMARWRAVENRMPLVRSANTGISVLVGASGRVVAQVPLNEQGFVVGALPVVRVATIYSRWGEWVAGVCLLTVLVGLGYRTRAPSGRTQVE